MDTRTDRGSGPQTRALHVALPATRHICPLPIEQAPLWARGLRTRAGQPARRIGWRSKGRDHLGLSTASLVRVWPVQFYAGTTGAFLSGLGPSRSSTRIDVAVPGTFTVTHGFDSVTGYSVLPPPG